MPAYRMTVPQNFLISRSSRPGLFPEKKNEVSGSLVSTGFHPTIWAVDLQRMTRGQEVSARGGEEITAGEQPRADMLSGVEGPLPCDVHEVMGAGAAQSDNAR